MHCPVVSAGDYAFSRYAVACVSSLLEHGCIQPQSIHYYVFDFSVSRTEYERNCYAAMLPLLKIDTRINIHMIPFRQMRGIIRMVATYKALSLTMDITDYLKAHIFTLLKKPYLWLDSDMLVRKPLKRLCALCAGNNALAMVARKGDPIRLPHYYAYYYSYCKERLPADARRRGTLSGGLIFIPSDLSRQWRALYAAVASPRSGMVTGQGVWNTLFWLQSGVYLPDKYNVMYGRSGEQTAAIVHFVRGYKEKMLRYSL